MTGHLAGKWEKHGSATHFRDAHHRQFVGAYGLGRPVMVRRQSGDCPPPRWSDPQLWYAPSSPTIWGLHTEPTRWQRDEFRDGFFAGAVASGSAVIVIHRESDAPIGSSRYFEYEAEADAIFVGYTLRARALGRGNQW